MREMEKGWFFFTIANSFCMPVLCVLHNTFDLY
uniref:Uncharacterized protein n=1 Tax=Rhizophora mucronata TaxID=61149 RepID=A0A2P2NQT5_RHIMU